MRAECGLNVHGIGLPTALIAYERSSDFSLCCRDEHRNGNGVAIKHISAGVRIVSAGMGMWEKCVFSFTNFQLLSRFKLRWAKTVFHCLMQTEVLTLVRNRAYDAKNDIIVSLVQITLGVNCNRREWEWAYRNKNRSDNTIRFWFVCDYGAIQRCFDRSIDWLIDTLITGMRERMTWWEWEGPRDWEYHCRTALLNHCNSRHLSHDRQTHSVRMPTRTHDYKQTIQTHIIYDLLTCKTHRPPPWSATLSSSWGLCTDDPDDL